MFEQDNPPTMYSKVQNRGWYGQWEVRLRPTLQAISAISPNKIIAVPADADKEWAYFSLVTFTWPS